MQDKKTQTEIEEEEYEKFAEQWRKDHPKSRTDDDIDPTPF